MSLRPGVATRELRVAAGWEARLRSENASRVKNFSSSTIDLAPLNPSLGGRPGHGAFQSQPILHGGRADPSVSMETMINNANISFAVESLQSVGLVVTDLEVCAWER